MDARVADTIELLETFSQERGQHDRAADGPQQTVEALQKGQVRTLILTDARDTTATATAARNQSTSHSIRRTSPRWA